MTPSADEEEDTFALADKRSSTPLRVRCAELDTLSPQRAPFSRPEGLTAELADEKAGRHGCAETAGSQHMDGPAPADIARASGEVLRLRASEGIRAAARWTEALRGLLELGGGLNGLLKRAAAATWFLSQREQLFNDVSDEAANFRRARAVAKEDVQLSGSLHSHEASPHVSKQAQTSYMRALDRGSGPSELPIVANGQ